MAVRNLRPLDTLGLFWFKRTATPSHALTLGPALVSQPVAYSSSRFLRFSVWPTGWRRCWVGTSWPLFQVVARAGPRAGPAVWEIKELYLNHTHDQTVPGVLEAVSARAASASAVRVVIRVRDDDEAVKAIRRASYVPVYQEHVYRRAGRTDSRCSRPAPPTEMIGLRRRRASDLHGLFRLYSVATPLPVRSSWAMTAREWTDILEPTPPGSEDWVVEQQGELRAWIRIGRVRSATWILVVASPKCEAERLRAVEVLLANSGGDEVVSLVPHYDITTVTMFENLGFQREHSFQLLSRTLPIRSAQPARVVATAGP